MGTAKTAAPEVMTVVELHLVTNGRHGQKGWIHTHGMDKLGCAELEIRNVPLFLAVEAGELLNHVAQYLIDQKRGGGPAVHLGQTMSTGQYSTFRFVKLPPIVGSEHHFQSERWALSDEPMQAHCDCECKCECGDCKCERIDDNQGAH